MSNNKSSEIKQVLQKYQAYYGRLAKGWISTLRGLIIISAVFSASSAVIGKLEILEDKPLLGLPRSDIAAILAASAAVVSTIQGAVKLEDNSQANRVARDMIKALELELLRDKPDYDEIINRMQKVFPTRLSMTGIDSSEVEKIFSPENKTETPEEQSNENDDSTVEPPQNEQTETTTSDDQINDDEPNRNA